VFSVYYTGCHSTLSFQLYSSRVLVYILVRGNPGKCELFCVSVSEFFCVSPQNHPKRHEKIVFCNVSLQSFYVKEGKLRDVRKKKKSPFTFSDPYPYIHIIF